MCKSTEVKRTGLYRRFFSVLLARCTGVHDRLVADRKQTLFAGLHGTVLEIGPGTGTNLRYYPKGVHWIGIEPNIFMHSYIRKEANRLGMNIDLRSGVGEALDFADSSVDAVVSTLVLCSVDDQAAVLSEVVRVLRPGGRFIFIEHVAAPKKTWTRRIQRWVRPAWRVLGDGCHPDRDTANAIEQVGFAQVECERFSIPMPVVWPHIAGVATKGQTSEEAARRR